MVGKENFEFRTGEIYGFKTAPVSPFSAPETGRYAAFKVIGAIKDEVCVLILEGYFSEPPRADQVAHLEGLNQQNPRRNMVPACCFVPAKFEGLKACRLIGKFDVSGADEGLVKACRSYAAWTFVSIIAESEWRWRHEREAYEEEMRLFREDERRRMVAEDERLRKRLKTLTWEKLLSETPLFRWQEHPPSPPAAFVAAARERFHAAARELRNLGAKPKKAAVRAVLKDCVMWLNAQDEAFGNVIETEEREDLYAALEELAYVARQKSLMEEVDEWRNW